MNDPQLLSARVAECNAQSLSVQCPAADSVNPSDECPFACKPEQTQPLADEDREVAIKHASRQIEAHMALYAETGDLGERGAADGARLRMEALIRGRSPEAVKRMESERGLA